jgi:hypothetical protein
MRNAATLDTLNRKTLQLNALVSVLTNLMPGNADALTSEEFGDFAWLMADLMSDIRAVLNSETEGVRHG